MVVMSIEWKGPLCSMKGTRRSKSGRMEIRKSRGMFTLTLNSFDVAFPDKYPRARCPTANEVHHLGDYAFFLELLSCMFSQF